MAWVPCPRAGQAGSWLPSGPQFRSEVAARLFTCARDVLDATTHVLLSMFFVGDVGGMVQVSMFLGMVQLVAGAVGLASHAWLE
eukprot:11395099-Alexandrium_andersonii.AAC.1